MLTGNTRTTMMSWLKAAALRINKGESITLDNGKNELDVMFGCATQQEALQSIAECSVLGQTNQEIRHSYDAKFSAVVKNIHAHDPSHAQQILNAAKDIGKETPWLWYAATSVSHDLEQ
ncbi:MAG: hypothetical protein COA45_08355 [Zetaproteobacteria bacterium]|nr:MAG: hypothetical protein COA45_08355 [Zetaproteobacteria bacterium]